MPVKRVPGGWKVKNVPKVHDTKKAAVQQMRAIYANKKKS